MSARAVTTGAHHTCPLHCRAPGPTITPHPASSGLPPSDAADEAKHIYHALAPRPPSAPPTRAQSNVMQETAAVAPPPPAPRQLEPPALSQPLSLPAQPLPTKPPPEPARSSIRSSAPPSGEPPPPRAKRVAVAFYGLTRSLRFTAASIHANILGPLRDAGYAVETFLHTYDLQHLRNERSHEDADLNSTEWRLLQPDHHAVTHQARPCLPPLCVVSPHPSRHTPHVFEDVTLRAWRSASAPSCRRTVSSLRALLACHA